MPNEVHFFSSQKPTIRAERRRPGSTPPPEGRPRADAPVRRQPGGSSGGGPVSGGGMPSLPGGLPRSPLGIGLMILLLICIVPIYLLTGGLGGDDGGVDTDPLNTPVAELPAGPTATRRPTRTPGSAVTSGDTWLVMLYQDADDKILEQDIFFDLNEAERVGSSPQVQIVAQLDRYQAGFSGDGDWSDARRYYVTQDDDLNSIGSEVVESLREVNMADGKTLVDFVAWAVQNYPADKYVLIMSDHGMGWPGGWSDPTASDAGPDRLPLAQLAGDHLFLNEIDRSLEEARQQAGIDQFELIGMDACLMGHIEVISALAPHARYAVLSQETEPALGWAYTSFLDTLNQNPAMTGGDLAEAIVESYIRDDQRITDESARQDFAGRGQPLGSLFGPIGAPTADEVATQLSQNITLSALDLQSAPDLIARLNDFAVSLQEADQRTIAQARSYSQSFTNIFGKDTPSPYIDLGNFLQLSARSAGLRAIGEAANALAAAINAVVIDERHGPRVPGATGISVYFPNSALYGSEMAGAASYTATADRFAQESLWDDFLAFHYTGETFDLDTGVVASPGAGAVRAPAAGGIQVSAVTASASEAAPGQPVLLSFDVSGQNIGYIKLLVGFLDTAANSLYLADSDFLASPNSQEIGGVFYPEWGETEFTMEFEWEPIVYAISDGVTTAVALFTPESYGASSEEAVYSVEGIYTFAGSGEQRNARLLFSNGQMVEALGFTGSDEAGAPRAITPQPGDSFTILEKWMDLDSQGNVAGVARQEGATLTFGEELFTWEVLDAAAGQYEVGFIVEDLDGNSQAVYQSILVR